MEQFCRHCRTSYAITAADLDFYDKVSPAFGAQRCQIPAPKLCPECRAQNQSAWRNEYNYYSRKCDLCSKGVISIHAPGKTFPVYCHSCWWSDKWDPLDFGVSFNEAVPFLDQFFALQQRVPQIALMNDNGLTSENCEYCQDFSRGKNCYLVTGSWFVQDSMYGSNVSRAKDCVDCKYVNLECELVYESVDCQRLYNCSFLQLCSNCSNCHFGLELRGCSDCFGCVGLRQKRFHLFNEPLSEAEYRSRLKEFDLGSYALLEKIKQQFAEFSLQFPRRAVYLVNCEECRGDNLFNCKNLEFSYDTFSAEYSKFCYRSDGPQHCYDIWNSGQPKWCYQGLTPDTSYMTCFTTWCWNDKYTFYSDNCHSSEYLFGCVSIKRKNYCILNKVYSKQEYENLFPKIVQNMIKTGAWGEFFPISRSIFGYNETVAQDLFPITIEDARMLHYPWKEEEKRTYKTATYSIPDHVRDVQDQILSAILECSACNKNYKILPLELEFYRKMNLALPRACPTCRRQTRRKFHKRMNLWVRSCASCNKEMETVYPPHAPELVYCEECFERELYGTIS